MYLAQDMDQWRALVNKKKKKKKKKNKKKKKKKVGNFSTR
jgi:hypothetical protein